MKRRSVWNVLLVFVLILGLVANPLQGLVKAAGEEKEITILHTNDIHGRDTYDEKNGSIGYSKYKTIIEARKAQGPTLVLDAGDSIHGTNFANLSKGEAPIKLMKEVGTSAMTPGNHEFNYGTDRLLELEGKAGFDFLAANIEKEDGSKPFKAYEVYEEGGVRVGVFGIATPETKYKSHPNNTKGINFINEVDAADAAVEALKEKEVDFIVGLVHLGVDKSSKETTYTLIDGMKNKADVDVIIDGHSHTTFENGQAYNGGFIASTGSYFNNIGELKLKKDAEGKKTVSASLIHFADTANTALDTGVDTIAKTYLDANDEILKEVIGNTTTELDGLRAHVRTGETNLADLITDSMLKATGADAVITNGGGIRASIDAGEITMSEALEVLPFGNLVTVIKVKGQAIVDALKHGAGDYPGAKGAFPQVAGLKYTIKLSGGQVTVEDVMVGDKAIDLAKEYTLATNDFMAVGGDGYTMFEGAEQVQLHGSMLDIFADYLRELSKDGPFTAKADGRIKVIEDKSLTIIHTNDIHGRVGETEATKDKENAKDKIIGYSRYKTFVDQKKAEGPTLVLDAGDAIHGTNFANLSKGEAPIKLMNEVGVKAMSPGNHEFNYGYDRLLELEGQAGFDFLAGNIEKEDGSKPFKAYEIYQEGNVKVGVFGIATPETKYKSHPNNTKGLNFTDEAKAADAAVAALKAEGVDFIVGLVHLGVDKASDVTTYTLLDGMANKADVDVIIDGHSHTVFTEGERYKDNLIASTGSYFNNIGLVSLTKKVDGTRTNEAKLVTYEEAKDFAYTESVDAIIKGYNDTNDEVLKEVIGNTATELDGLRAHVRTGETNLADLITDAMLKATGADAVITNGGGIRASIDAGEITMSEALEVLPFGNLVTVIKVKGQAIVDALNHGAGDYPEAKGAFPQVAGLKYTIKLEDGQATVEDVMVGDKAIDLDKEYTLATNDFMAVGGDGYTMFEGAEQVQLHGSMLDIFADYLRELSKDGPFTSKADGRIKVVDYGVFEEVSGFAATDLNVRDRVTGKVIGVLPGLSQVNGKRYPFKDNYIEIEFKGQKGFVYAPLVADGIYEGYASTDINKRKAANGEISGLLKKGSHVKGAYFNTDKNWLLIKHDGRYSYVYKPLLQNDPVSKSGYLIYAMNFRKQPKLGDNVIRVLPEAMKIAGTIDSENLSWIKVSYYGQVGYIYAPRLAKGISEGYASSELNYRSQPNGKILGTVKKGEFIKGYYFEESPNWTQYRKAGQNVYVYNKFLTSKPVK